MLTTPNLDATGHRSIGALASYEFTLEYQKGSDIAVADTLSQVPVRHDKDTVRSLLEGAVTSTNKRGEILMSQPLRVEHNCLSEEMQARPHNLAPMHVTNWAEAEGEDVLLATCQEWMRTRKDVSLQRKDALLRRCMGEHSDSKEAKVLFHIRNSLTMKKGMLYVNTTPKRRDQRTVGLCGSLHTSTCSSQWHVQRCWTPRSATNIGTSTRVFLVAKNG